MSETHSLNNVRRTHEQMLEEVRGICAQINGLPVDQRSKFEGGSSICFGCSLEGHVPEDKVVRIAETFMETGCDEVGLSDTTGFACPLQVRRLIQEVWNAVGKVNLTGIHFHYTRGQGLANALAAVEVG